MVYINLSHKERKLVAEVAKLYNDMAIRLTTYNDLMTQFWRISLYVRIGWLRKHDLQAICVAMEQFNQAYKANPSYKDPTGMFANLDDLIPKVKAIYQKKVLDKAK